METDFNKMSQEELINYVESYDFQSNDNYKAKELKWSFIPSFKLSSISVNNMNTNEWIDWINNQQVMLNKELDYDRYKEVEDYWIPNPNEEPVIMIQRENGTHDIADGCHRTGLAFRNNLLSIPIILGMEM
jgi:hypothetical protein